MFDGKLAALVLVAAALNGQLIRVYHNTKVAALRTQRTSQAGFPRTIYAADKSVCFHGITSVFIIPYCIIYTQCV